jgi:hypothetical protein
MKTALRVEGEEDLKGAGLTAEEIALSPEIGAWSEEPEMPTTENSVGEGLWQR